MKLETESPQPQGARAEADALALEEARHPVIRLPPSQCTPTPAWDPQDLAARWMNLDHTSVDARMDLMQQVIIHAGGQVSLSCSGTLITLTWMRAWTPCYG